MKSERERERIKRNNRRAILKLVLIAVALLAAIIAVVWLIWPKQQAQQSEPSQTQSQELVSPQMTPTADDSDFGRKYADKFSQTVIADDSSYRSENLSIRINKGEYNGAVYFAADIYVRDMKHFKTAFSSEYGKFELAKTPDMAKQNQAVLAISGDYYIYRKEGIVIRNGEVYRESLFEDVCVLYDDGRMETYSPDEFDLEKAVEDGAYQAWSFGPMLLKDGKATDTFLSDVPSQNPRCVLGYFEPGHYGFLVVDGRQPGYSEGLTLQDLSSLCEQLGYQAAYNMDGGQTAMMVFQGEIVNQPYNGGRSTSDIIYVGEE